MAALAELLLKGGAQVSGSDVEEEFYTDSILRELGILYKKGFDASGIQPEKWDAVVRSSAYPDDHSEVAVFLAAGKKVWNYTEALGALSAGFDSSGVSGIHGKTTTTALAGTLAKGLALDTSVLVGSAVRAFGNRSTWTGGKRFFIAETCEYQRHFLDFTPRRLILTSVEEDHLDYYKDLEDIKQAFISYMDLLPRGGKVIYSADDPGAVSTFKQALAKRPDLVGVPYGINAEGPYRITHSSMEKGQNSFQLQGFSETFTLPLPGEYLQWNAAAALALTDLLLKEEGRSLKEVEKEAAAALKDFSGTRRRSEIIGEAGGVLVMDDYGHHPHAIDLTLKGLKSFYADRRLVVSFMSHTYTRSAALLEEFARCFSAADKLILHDIYSSAREKFDGSLTGEAFAERISREHGDTEYCATIEDTRPRLKEILRPGDLFLTLGAGNNWPLGRWVLQDLGGTEK